MRLTAEDGYQAQRSYSIASAPEDEHLVLTVERLDDGEVSPYLVDELQPGDELELRGPIGGYFVWEEALGGPLLLVAGGSGVVPLRAMLRHHRAVGSEVPVRLLYSARSLEDVIYRDELMLLAEGDVVDVHFTLTRVRPDGWQGYARRIDRELLEEVAWHPRRDRSSTSAAPRRSSRRRPRRSSTLGHEPGMIRTERFGATGG